MTIKDLSNRILLRNSGPYDAPADSVPHKEFETLYSRILQKTDKEEDETFNSYFWEGLKEDLPFITKALFATILITLAEKNVHIRARHDNEIAERLENDERVDDLIWEELKKIIAF